MSTRLTNIKIEECSLVDRPANAEILDGVKVPRAVVALWKRESIEKIIREERGKWHVYSEDGGKHLGGPYDSKEEAVRRLRQIEWFKQHKSEGDEGREPGVLKGEPMTLEEIEKRQDALEAENKQLKADNDALKSEVQTLKAAQEKSKGCSPQGDEQMMDEEMKKKLEDVSKAADEKVSKAEERIAKLEAENSAILKRERLAHFTAIAKADLSHTSGTDAEKGGHLMTLAESLGGEESEAYKSMFGTLKAADAAIASQFVEKGTGRTGVLPGEAALESKAQEIRKQDGNLTYAMAYERACQQNPQLFEQAQTDIRQRIRTQ